MSRKKTAVKSRKNEHRKLAPFARFLCFAMIAASVVMLGFAVREAVSTYKLQKQLVEVQSKLQEAQDQNKYLNSEKEKLQDPDYVQNYARGNYMLSKDGEQIFYLPEDVDK